MTDPQIFDLCATIREDALGAHRFLRHGHLERIYESSMSNRLHRRGLLIQRQFPLAVRDEDGTVLGEFIGDLLVENELLLELKAVHHLLDEHTAQTLGYLRASRLRHALLINFGSPKIQIKKLIFDVGYAPSVEGSS